MSLSTCALICRACADPPRVSAAAGSARSSPDRSAGLFAPAQRQRAMHARRALQSQSPAGGPRVGQRTPAESLSLGQTSCPFNGHPVDRDSPREVEHGGQLTPLDRGWRRLPRPSPTGAITQHGELGQPARVESHRRTRVIRASTPRPAQRALVRTRARVQRGSTSEPACEHRSRVALRLRRTLGTRPDGPRSCSDSGALWSSARRRVAELHRRDARAPDRRALAEARSVSLALLGHSLGHKRVGNRRHSV